MKNPDYLTYYFREGQTLFDVLSDKNPKQGEEILKNDVLWRGDGTYLSYRKAHELKLRQKFIQKGRNPNRKWPIYAILGNSPSSIHSLENEYQYKLIMKLKDFGLDDVSFTYPDSIYVVPLDDLGKLNLDRNDNPIVYTINDLSSIIEIYKVYEHDNHYIEAQIWNDKPLEEYMNNKEIWQNCIPNNL